MRITQLSALTVLVQRSHLSGSQLWHGLPALAQGQLHKEQEAAPSRSSRGQRGPPLFLAVYCTTPPGRGAHHGQGVNHADCLLCEKCVFLLAASSVCSGGSAMGNWLQQQQPLIVVFRCPVGTGMRPEFQRRVQHVINAEKTQNDNGDD